MRERFKESTRKAILDAAVSLIIARGEDIRMEDIADQAGVAIGTLYNYFDNRQSLIDTIIDQRRAKAESFFRDSLLQTEGMHIIARLDDLFQTLYHFLRRHRAVTHHSLQMKEVRVDNSGRKTMMAMLNEHVAVMLAQAAERGEIRSEYMDIYPLVISGCLKEIFQKAGEEPELDNIPGFTKKMAELLLNGAAPTARQQQG
ncbi:MAG TPA: TetR/AcrR family transcriptional regulator [Candidatus Syntrophosphaera sp.]|nr:TetR/AcrR family transcriptional regulator [Candidatus Syntrophosphaera sp.]